MVMLSDLLRSALVDRHRREARLLDLAVDLSAGDFPPVTDLLVLDAGTKKAALLPAQAAVPAAGRALRLSVEDLGTLEPPSADWLAGTVLLKRDIMDAMVLDLKDRIAYRANDLSIEAQDGRLILSGVDVSLRAVLRRVSRGLIRAPAPEGLREWRIVEFLRGDPAAARAGRDYHRLIGRLPAGEIANLADALPYLHAAELVTLLPDAKAVDTLESMLPERQLQVFEELDAGQAKRLLSLMRPDIVADLLGRLEPDEVRSWLEYLPTAQYKRVLGLLHYADDSAGGIMTNDLIVLPSGMLAADALAEVRRQLRLPGFTTFVQMLYVVEDGPGRRLQGALSLHDLLVADEGQTLAEIMDPYVVTVHHYEPAIRAARRVIENELPALPVIGEAGEVLGAVTVGAALVEAIPGGWGRREAPRIFP